jgi:aryl-alcohol dehydrogenase-like predicted oxidoreductase
MRYTRFGQTALEGSRVCFRTWQFSGDWGSNEEKNLVDAMRRALDLGINLFDTAQAYGFGTSEQIVGKALEPEIKSRRER